MCDHLAEDLIDRWIMTVEPSHVVACYLDPRFKTLNFIEDRPLRRCIKTLIHQKVEEIKFACEKDSKATDSGADQKKKKNSLLDSLFSSEPLASKTNEVTTYNDMPIADKNTNILQWWKDHEAQLPRLGKPFCLT